ncbi:sulfur carrier protein ThiS [Klugiella xanthotipulae]|uniref:Sulfur carrier protein ThiS n=2 Tax=Klugiella xanthotipulae TaxID=244735 RepID=A0A543HT22_9MICO|nr:sulfur carrier protein ThiS [Klugiella xanthotipulae]
MTPSPDLFSVNGLDRPWREGQALDDIILTFVNPEVAARPDVVPGGIAAAINDVVVPRSRWSVTHPVVGDRVEILTAVQGG